MPIYVDKRDGKPTGQWRVECERQGFKKYRKRHLTHLEAQEDEKRVKALWDQGVTDVASVAAQRGPGYLTLSQAVNTAKGVLWRDNDTQDIAWQRMAIMVPILGKDTGIEEIDTPMVRKLAAALLKKGKSNATVNRYLSHLRTFLVWHVQNLTRKTSVETVTFDWHKEDSHRIRWITEAEEATLLTLVPDNVGKLILVALATGCRRDELLTARLDQINGTLLHLWDTKTDDDRTVPMTQETTDMLTELITQKTMPTRRSLRSWWDRARAKMGLSGDPAFVFHACRHTCATRMVDAGVDIRVIQEWLGHKVLQTTLRYAHVKPSTLEAALLKVGGNQDRKAQNLSNSGAPQGPPHVPPSGGNGQISLAA